jgi:hypothetical protein
MAQLSAPADHRHGYERAERLANWGDREWKSRHDNSVPRGEVLNRVVGLAVLSSFLSTTFSCYDVEELPKPYISHSRSHRAVGDIEHRDKYDSWK